tara:strand:- start:336 stop:479 length:144 start_codon:yes stop_codon:yes gene_type:complete
MTDLRNQLDRAMDEIKEEMIRDIIDDASNYNNQELNKASLEILEVTN